MNQGDARVTGRIPNFLFSSDGGNANDTILYSELLVDPTNDTVLANYIDLEEATGTTFKENPFESPVPQAPDAARTALDAAIAQYTAQRFTGSTLWDLIKFTFAEVWNARLPNSAVVVENIEVGVQPSSGGGVVHEAVLLDYGGLSGLGLVLFVNLGVKAAILFDAGQNSSWGDVGTFTSTIQPFVSAFLEPLAEILHAAGADQTSILSSDAPAAEPASCEIRPSQATSFLSRSDFLSLAGVLMATFPVPTFPFIMGWNQIALIIVIVVAISLVIYYGISSYSKEKKKVPEGQPREQPWYS
ncbi:MAG: hypothetical protein JW839_23245 [Candidatus Lokiarchaeota archaeon]|nr:hypothetical protein [Candidatus Lokiarchaeota archaeon]